MPTHPRTVLTRSSKRFRIRAESTTKNLFRWSAAPITTRFSWRALLRSRCCSSLAATDTATVQTSTHLQKILLEERSCSPRHSQPCPSDTATTLFTMPSVCSLCFKRFADPRVARLYRGIDEINALLVGQEGALHGIDREPLEVVQR